MPPGCPKPRSCGRRRGGFTIRLDSDRIGGPEYETYVAYQTRKLLLPRLRLETERLVLRPFAPEDAPAYLAFFADEDDARMDSGLLFTEMDDAYRRLMDSFAAQTRCTILRKDGGDIVGTVNLLDVEDRAVEAMEIGYGIAPGYKRRGYAYEALSALLRCLLYDLHLDMVVAGAFPDNTPSLELLRKLGFRCEGRRHKAFWNELRGPMDLACFYLEREDGVPRP